ncbi:MAG: single-stranded nucleic acid binding protein spoIIIJ-associated protein [Candidatus Parcubacteria bacterium]|jgi:spoIIIJ-associated protein
MDKVQIIKTEVDALLTKLVDSFESSVDQDGEAYYVTIKTDEGASTVIGRHGETIRALQKILEVILFKSLGESLNILVNVNDYREKQTERLHQLATELVQKAQEAGKPIHYRGLSSYERKVIHEYITSAHPDLTTYSIGEGRDRHLVVDQKKNEPETDTQPAE